jgi:phosphoribosylformylglycinamidine (FGAM) synthase PurS component
MRTLAPADSLVYLETNDLAAALQPIVDSKPFNEVAEYKPDFSALKGVQLAVAVTGFETSEEKLTDENSIGRIQPHFVAIADTHAWNYQAVKFAEQKLGSFVEKIYDSQPTLEKSDRSGGKYFTWTAPNNGAGRKAYALVIDSLIYFGNDESSIEKCLAVRRGESDSIIKTGKVQPADPATLARGYVSTDGIAQIANILALKLAAEASDESEVKSAIASIVPQLLRNTVVDVAWTAAKSEQGYEDLWQITMPPDVASAFSGAMAPGKPDTTLLDYVSPQATTATLYNLRDPKLALRNVTAEVQEKSGPVAREVIAQILTAVVEQYGVANLDLFLDSVGPTVVTASLEGFDHPVVISTLRNTSKLEVWLSQDLKMDSAIKPAAGSTSLMTWKSDEDDFAACLNGKIIEIGYTGLGGSCGKPQVAPLRPVPKEDATTTTVGRERGIGNDLVPFFMNELPAAKPASSSYVTETRFTKTGIERRTVSDFGFIGWIVAQLNED